MFYRNSAKQSSYWGTNNCVLNWGITENTVCWIESYEQPTKGVSRLECWKVLTAIIKQAKSSCARCPTWKDCPLVLFRSACYEKCQNNLLHYNAGMVMMVVRRKIQSNSYVLKCYYSSSMAGCINRTKQAPHKLHKWTK